MTAQKEEWVQVGLCRYLQSYISSLQSLEKDLTFFTAVVYNTKSQKNTKQVISPATENSKYDFLLLTPQSNLEVFFLLPIILKPEVNFACLNANCNTKKKIQINFFYYVYQVIYTLLINDPRSLFSR